MKNNPWTKCYQGNKHKMTGLQNTWSDKDWRFGTVITVSVLILYTEQYIWFKNTRNEWKLPEKLLQNKYPH